jgi:hypothetical protein
MSEKYPMNLQGIVKFLCEREGKLSEVSVGNMREIVSLMSDLVYGSDGITAVLYANGKRRSKKKKTRN